MNMPYTVDHFISKFEAIPDSRWAMGFFVLPGTRKKCAQGHCGLLRWCQTIPPEALALRALFSANFSVKEPVAEVNNGWHPDYKRPTPKLRILAALRDIKAKQI